MDKCDPNIRVTLQDGSHDQQPDHTDAEESAESREGCHEGLQLHAVQDEEARLKLKDIAHQTISAIRLVKIKSDNWYAVVHGIIDTTDDQHLPFSYAYNTRREGFIMCDANPRFFIEGVSPHTHDMVLPVMNDELKAELQKFPRRDVSAEQRAKYAALNKERQAAKHKAVGTKQKRRLIKATAA